VVVNIALKVQCRRLGSLTPSWKVPNILTARHAFPCCNCISWTIICFNQTSGCCYRNPSLGFATKAKACNGVGQEEALESHLMFPRVQGNKPSHSQRRSHFGKLDSQWTFKFLESDCKGQNPMDWVVLYTIEMVLELRCLKWAWMTHLDIWNTSYGEKKGWEFNWQFDSQSLKVRNCHKFLTCRCLATYRWKAFD
jgi:hypothetical protein